MRGRFGRERKAGGGPRRAFKRTEGGTAGQLPMGGRFGGGGRGRVAATGPDAKARVNRAQKSRAH